MRLAFAALLITGPAFADAPFVTRAMKATTIVEVFVTRGQVRVEMEIGAADLRGFHNLLPDGLRRQMGLAERPYAERIKEFFEKDWVVTVDSEPLDPQVERAEARPRVLRDPITGEPIGEDEESALFVELVYRFEGRPKTLTLRPPKGDAGVAANIGFVLYHEGVAVNDFRYLGAAETLDFDWEDAWYTRFRNRNLRRQYDAPLHAFLYIDAFEVRKEIIVRPRDLQQWVDLGIEGQDFIRAQDQPELKRKAAAFLAQRNPVEIDGRKLTAQLDRIHFVRRTLRTTGVVDPPEDLPAVSATLGVIFVYPIAGLPREVTMEWELFSPRIQSVPAVATDEAGGFPSRVTPGEPVLRWENFLKNPSSQALEEIEPPPQGAGLVLPVLSAVCVALAALALSKRNLTFVVILLVAAFFLRSYVQIPLGGGPEIGEDKAERVIAGLLKNIYRAFDYRGEGIIYDTLARSAHGDLLNQVYLETQKMLELANQGGARAKIKSVEMVKTETAGLDDGVGFRSRCTWNVAGSVGHWGHIHQRRNQYEAELTVEPVDGAWKITKLDLLSEKRL